MKAVRGVLAGEGGVRHRRPGQYAGGGNSSVVPAALPMGEKYRKKPVSKLWWSEIALDSIGAGGPFDDPGTDCRQDGIAP